MWISSYCIACIYQQNTKVEQLFSLLTYEDSHLPAMKETIHICGVDNLVEEINNIILIILFHHEKTEKKTGMTALNLLPIGEFSIVFCIASYSICFNPVAWQSSGPNNNHRRFYLNLSIP